MISPKKGTAQKHFDKTFLQKIYTVNILLLNTVNIRLILCIVSSIGYAMQYIVIPAEVTLIDWNI